jgi:cytochrome c oxidase assembly factor CtaG
MNELLKMSWTWYPSVVIGFSLWTLLYIYAIRRGKAIPLSYQVAFHVGTLIGLLALVSPLDELGDEYLFSAHMVQHIMLMFFTAPLWLIGTPNWMIDMVIPKFAINLVKRIVKPPFAFGIFMMTLWIWHIPMFYELAFKSEGMHIFEHLTFIGAAIIGWWPVAGADSSSIPKPDPPIRLLYLFLLAIPCTGLAALLTFSNQPFYPFYVNTPHIFGLTALQDQHLGGLIMWLPTHIILLAALGFTFFRWIFRPMTEINQRVSDNSVFPVRLKINQIKEAGE